MASRWTLLPLSAAAASSPCRLGELTMPGRLAVRTPCYVMSNDHGCSPHLTDDVVQGHYRPGVTPPFQIAFENFIPLLCPPVEFRSSASSRAPDQESISLFIERFSDGLTAYCGMDRNVALQRVFIGALRSSHQARLDLVNTKNAVSAAVNGTCFAVTPESFMAASRAFRPDLLIALNDCTPNPTNCPVIGKRKTSRNLIYLSRMIVDAEEKNDVEQTAMIGVLDGDDLMEVRVETATQMVSQFDERLLGYSMPINGLNEERVTGLLQGTIGQLPNQKMRLSSGAASLQGVIAAIRAGVDLIDCSWLSEMSDRGMIIMEGGVKSVVVGEQDWERDQGVLEEGCPCPACADLRHTRAYVQHLSNVNDMLACVIISLHNLAQIDRLFDGVRAAIRDNRLEEFLSPFTKP